MCRHVSWTVSRINTFENENRVEWVGCQAQRTNLSDIKRAQLHKDNTCSSILLVYVTFDVSEVKDLSIFLGCMYTSTTTEERCLCWSCHRFRKNSGIHYSYSRNFAFTIYTIEKAWNWCSHYITNKRIGGTNWWGVIKIFGTPPPVHTPSNDWGCTYCSSGYQRIFQQRSSHYYNYAWTLHGPSYSTGWQD